MSIHEENETHLTQRRWIFQDPFEKRGENDGLLWARRPSGMHPLWVGGSSASMPPSMSGSKKGPAHFRQAYWVVEAAAEQGIEGARLRAQWIKSFEPLGFNAWCRAVDEVFAKYRDREFVQWPEAIKETLEMEWGLQEHAPHRHYRRTELLKKWALETYSPALFKG